MAVHALQPAPAPANPLHAPFNLAMARHAAALARQHALTAPYSMVDDLAAAEAMETALARLTATPAPDTAAPAIKLRVTLNAAGVPAPTIAALVVDVRRLACREVLA